MSITRSKVTVDTSGRNTAPSDGLPDHVAGSPGGLPGYPIPVPAGTNITSVGLPATEDAELVSANVKGEKAIVSPGVGRGHPPYETQLNIMPGQSPEVTSLLEAATPGRPYIPVQPLLDDVTPALSVPECSGLGESQR